MYVCKDMNKDAPNGFIHNSQTLEIIQTLMSKRMEEQVMVHPYKKHYTAIKERKKLLIHTAMQMGLKTIKLSQRSQTYDSTCCMIQSHGIQERGKIICGGRSQNERGWGGVGFVQKRT